MLKFIFFVTAFIFVKADLPTLTIYTYSSFTQPWGTAPKIKKIFEEANHCHLKFVTTTTSIGTLRKVQLEGKRTQADIVLGLDTSLISMAKKTNIFVKHDVNLSKMSLPFGYNDSYFVPYDYNYFAFVYNSDKLKSPPTSFEALANMPEDFKIIIQNPRSSTIGFGFVLWVQKIYADKAEEYWHKLSKHILTITKGWSEAYGLFLRGEADMVLSYTTSPAYHILEENRTNIKSAIFTEGHYGQIEVAGIVKYSKQKALANKFLSFMHSKAFATIIPTTNWSYPVVKTTLPDVYSQIHKPSKMLMLESETVEKNRNRYISIWRGAIHK